MQQVAYLRDTSIFYLHLAVGRSFNGHLFEGRWFQKNKKTKKLETQNEGTWVSSISFGMPRRGYVALISSLNSSSIFSTFVTKLHADDNN